MNLDLQSWGVCVCGCVCHSKGQNMAFREGVDASFWAYA